MHMYSAGFFFFFFNDTATTEIYTLSLHDALPICQPLRRKLSWLGSFVQLQCCIHKESSMKNLARLRSEEHTSELQSRLHLVCRLLLEKKKKIMLLNTAPSSQMNLHT